MIVKFLVSAATVVGVCVGAAAPASAEDDNAFGALTCSCAQTAPSPDALLSEINRGLRSAHSAGLARPTTRSSTSAGDFGSDLPRPMTAGTALDTAALDKALHDLYFGAPGWAALPLAEKVAMLEALPRKALDLAPQMVAAAADAKGIAPSSTWTAEEWSVGVWVFIHAVNTQLLVLKRILAGRNRSTATRYIPGPTAKLSSMSSRSPGTTVSCSTAIAPRLAEASVSAEQARNDAATTYRGPTRGPAEVCLVLAAGNLGTITTLDVIDQLYVRGNVCAVKMHPVNDYLGPFYEQIFSEFISRGWLRFLYGGADAGAYLAHHRKVDTVHMTGSAATYDAIVWGTDDRAAARRADDAPLLDKPISAELGGVSPLVRGTRGLDRCRREVPGRTHSDNQTHQLWPQLQCHTGSRRATGLATDRKSSSPKFARSFAMPSHGPRTTPHTAERTAKACAGMAGTEFLAGDNSRALIPNVEPGSVVSILTDEVFAGVLGVVRLPVRRQSSSSDNAVEFANEALPGTLGAVVAINPKTRKQNSVDFDNAIRACATARSASTYGARWFSLWQHGERSPAIPRKTSAAAPGWCTTPSCCPTPQKAVSGDPIPPGAALCLQRRADALAKAALFHHQQDSPDDDATARHIPSPPQPDRAARNPCLRTARMSWSTTNEWSSRGL